MLSGPRVAFADALSFLASAAIPARLPTNAGAPPTTHGSERRFWDDMRDGVQHIRSRRLLFVAVISGIAASFIIRGTDTLGAIVLKALGVGEGLQGLSFTALGLGYVVGAALVGQWGQRFAVLRLLGLSRVLIGAIIVLMGLAVAANLSGVGITLAAAFVTRVLIGAGFAASAVAYGFILQRETPAELMGRVVATTRSLITAVPLAGPLVATLLTRWIGLGVAYAALGSAMLLIGATVVALRADLNP